MDREPRLLATKYFEFRCNTDVKIVCDYFKKRKASFFNSVFAAKIVHRQSAVLNNTVEVS